MPCYLPCTIDTCGSTCSPSLKRSLYARSIHQDFNIENENVSFVGPHTSKLNKRVFQVDPTSSPAALTTYLQGVTTTPNYDATVGDIQPLIVGKDMQTCTVSARLGRRNINIGSAGLHGCTVLILLSRRAVYMVCYGHMGPSKMHSAKLHRHIYGKVAPLWDQAM